MRYADIAAARIPVVADADVVVIGGGPAGVGAAIRAARHGARTILIERFGSLGGINALGFMFITVDLGGRILRGVSKEIMERLERGGFVANILERYPDINANPLTHYGGPGGRRGDMSLLAFDPDMLASVMNDLIEETGVKIMLRSLFVDALVKDRSIKAVVVENASGKQAVEGRIFIDATGRADVVARSGAPFVRAACAGTGLPMSPGLMWKLAGVDLDTLFAYQRTDPVLEKLIDRARANGDVPYYRRKLTREDTACDFCPKYSGHPTLEMQPTLYPGEVLLWASAPYEMGLHADDTAEDATKAETNIRKQIVSEFHFLKRYVPGFERAHLAGIAPFLGLREGRHPIGEYVLTYDDLLNSAKFPDVALRPVDHIQVRTPRGPRLLDVEVPYRSFLARGLENLLLAGDAISAEHSAQFYATHLFPLAMSAGEVAGEAAGLALHEQVGIKALRWPGPI
jgi:hypothetical protein